MGNHSGNNHQPYNKSGGYRGRNNNPSHHNNQYQAQYSHQGHGGYNAQPYNIGYSDHFNQRAGYGLAGNVDPYMQGSGGYQSGFNNPGDEQNLSKGNKNKGNSRTGFSNNQNIHPYPHVSHPPGGQNQNHPSCAQVGSESSSHNASVHGTNGGLSYQNWGNGGL